MRAGYLPVLLHLREKHVNQVELLCVVTLNLLPQRLILGLEEGVFAISRRHIIRPSQSAGPWAVRKAIAVVMVISRPAVVGCR